MLLTNTLLTLLMTFDLLLKHPKYNFHHFLPQININLFLFNPTDEADVKQSLVQIVFQLNFSSYQLMTLTAKLRPKDILRTSPKNILTSPGRPHMVLYVTPRDTSLAGRPWDILKASI